MPELTTETSNTVREEDGSYTASISSVPVNYLDEAGEWQEIDTTLEEAPGERFAAVNDENSVVTEMPADASQAPVRVSDGDRWVSMRMQGLDGAPEVAGGTVTYSDTGDLVGADEVRYTVTPGGVKEDIVLEAPPASPVSYTFTVRASDGLTPVLAESGDIEFRDDTDAVVFRTPRGNMIDSAAPDPVLSEEVDYALTQASAGTWSLIVTPDMRWLLDPSRVYPLRVDPTTYLELPPSRACVINNVNSYNTCAPELLQVGRNSSGGYWRSLLRWDLGFIPTDATMEFAYSSLYQQNGQSPNGNSGTYAMYRVGHDWNPGSDWYTAAGYGAWNPVGGAPAERVSDQVQLNGLGFENGPRYFQNMTGIAQQWVQNPAANYGVVLKQETATQNRLFFSSGIPQDSRVPRLHVNFSVPNRAPAFVTGTMSVQPCAPAVPCTTSGTTSLTTTPTLSAKFSDVDSSSLSYAFTVRQVDRITNATANAASGSVSGAPSTDITWPVPEDKLRSGLTYQYQVRATDPAGAAVNSPWMWFIATSNGEAAGADAGDWDAVPGEALPATPNEYDPAEWVDMAPHDPADEEPLPCSPQCDQQRFVTRNAFSPEDGWAEPEPAGSAGSAAAGEESPVELVQVDETDSSSDGDDQDGSVPDSEGVVLAELAPVVTGGPQVTLKRPRFSAVPIRGAALG